VPSMDGRGGAPVMLPSYFFEATNPTAATPALSNKQAAVVMLHGCGGAYRARAATRAEGLSQRMREYAKFFNDRGVHVLVTDSLTPRGERELCTQAMKGRAISQRERRLDALGALQWLAEHPRVASERIGLVGWSHGGGTVLAAIDATHEAVKRSKVKPAMAVAFYPGCSASLKQASDGGLERPVGVGLSSTLPLTSTLTVMMGSLDDWTPPEPCRSLTQAWRQLGADVTLIEYAGAYHGFDGTSAVAVRTDVPNGVKPGQGVHAGGNPAARAASRLELDRLVNKFLTSAERP
jgi:dienelactone hydrolase